MTVFAFFTYLLTYWHDDDDDTTDHETYSTPRVFYGGSAVCDPETDIRSLAGSWGQRDTVSCDSL